MLICLNLLLDLLHLFKFIIVNELFFSFSKKKLSKKSIWVIVIAFSSSIAVIFVPVIWISFLIYILAIWGIFLLLYDEKAGTLLLVDIWSIFTLSLLDGLSNILLDSFLYIGDWKKSLYVDFFVQTVTLIFLLSIGWSLKRTGKGRFKRVGIAYMLLFTGLLIMETFVLGVLRETIMEMLRSEHSIRLRVAYIIVVLGIFLQILLMVLLIISRDESRENQKITQKYLEAQVEHYQYLEQREKETKRFRHDLRSHMFVLQSYMQNGQYEEMEQHLQEMYGTMEAFECRIQVNNNIVNAILNKCDAECRENGIELKVKGHFPVGCNISAYDLCTIVSNLLNNAREAAVKGTRHQILFNIRYTQEEIIFHVENDYTGNIVIKNGKICTKKSNRALHGMGLENVKRCVEKNHGYMDIRTDDQRFIVKIILVYGGWNEDSIN